MGNITVLTGIQSCQESDLMVAALHPAPQQDGPRQSLQKQWVCTGMLGFCPGISHASVGLVSVAEGSGLPASVQRRVWGVAPSPAIPIHARC